MMDKEKIAEIKVEYEKSKLEEELEQAKKNRVFVVVLGVIGTILFAVWNGIKNQSTFSFWIIIAWTTIVGLSICFGIFHGPLTDSVLIIDKKLRFINDFESGFIMISSLGIRNPICFDADGANQKVEICKYLFAYKIEHSTTVKKAVFDVNNLILILPYDKSDILVI